MKHATVEDLIPIAGLLDKIRREKRIKERKSGIFYWRGKAFLHFHENHVMLLPNDLCVSFHKLY